MRGSSRGVTTRGVSLLLEVVCSFFSCLILVVVNDNMAEVVLFELFELLFCIVACVASSSGSPTAMFNNAPKTLLAINVLACITGVKLTAASISVHKRLLHCCCRVLSNEFKKSKEMLSLFSWHLLIKTDNVSYNSRSAR